MKHQKWRVSRVVKDPIQVAEYLSTRQLATRSRLCANGKRNDSDYPDAFVPGQFSTLALYKQWRSCVVTKTRVDEALKIKVFVNLFRLQIQHELWYRSNVNNSIKVNWKFYLRLKIIEIIENNKKWMFEIIYSTSLFSMLSCLKV